MVGAFDLSTNQQAFRWTQSGGMVGLSYLPGQSKSCASGVSADGSVVVGSSYGSGTSQAFRWTQSGGMVGLASYGPYGEAHSVSADGSAVVGWTGPSADNQATRWTQSGIERLGLLDGASVYSYAYGVSADGSVVVGGSSQAFRWTQSGGMVGLGYLPGYSKASYAYGVSPDGSIVVGESGGEAFIWDSVNGMQDLKNLLMIIYGMDLNGWTLSEAYDISADGKTIVGYGINPLGQKEGWVANLNPVPIPGSALLFGSGMAMVWGRIAWDRRRRIKSNLEHTPPPI